MKVHVDIYAILNQEKSSFKTTNTKFEGEGKSIFILLASRVWIKPFRKPIEIGTFFTAHVNCEQWFKCKNSTYITLHTIWKIISK